MSQGMFVDVRELQLYYEQSKEFRERTLTHEKILRMVRAVENRSRMSQKEY
jgi:DNA primase large subunit